MYAFTNMQTSFNSGSIRSLQNTTNLDFSKHFPVLSGTNVAFGAELRKDGYNQVAGEEASWKNFDVTKGVAAGTQYFPGFHPNNAGNFSRTNQAVYIDLEQDFNKAFMVNTAIRLENYSDFGKTFNYKIAARYNIKDLVTLRGAVSTGFKAPGVQQIYYARTNLDFVNNELVETGTFTNESKLVSLLGLPKLKQETSQNYSLGATANIGHQFQFSLDYYQIAIKDRIILTNNFRGTAGSQLATLLKSQGVVAANFFTNGIDTKTSGLEGVLSYIARFAGKQELRATLAGTWLKNEVAKNSAGLPNVHAQDIISNSGQLDINTYFNREDWGRIEKGTPNVKGNLMLQYKTGKFSTMLRFAYFGGAALWNAAINPNDASTFPVNAYTGQKETLDETLSPKTITDASISYQFLKQVGLTIGCNNLFDVKPDLLNHYNNTVFGRILYLRTSQQMGVNGAYYFVRLKFDL